MELFWHDVTVVTKHIRLISLTLAMSNVAEDFVVVKPHSHIHDIYDDRAQVYKIGKSWCTIVIRTEKVNVKQILRIVVTPSWRFQDVVHQ